MADTITDELADIVCSVRGRHWSAKDVAEIAVEQNVWGKYGRVIPDDQRGKVSVMLTEAAGYHAKTSGPKSKYALDRAKIRIVRDGWRKYYTAK